MDNLSTNQAEKTRSGVTWVFSCVRELDFHNETLGRSDVRNEVSKVNFLSQKTATESVVRSVKNVSQRRTALRRSFELVAAEPSPSENSGYEHIPFSSTEGGAQITPSGDIGSTDQFATKVGKTPSASAEPSEVAVSFEAATHCSSRGDRAHFVNASPTGSGALLPDRHAFFSRGGADFSFLTFDRRSASKFESRYVSHQMLSRQSSTDIAGSQSGREFLPNPIRKSTQLPKPAHIIMKPIVTLSKTYRSFRKRPLFASNRLWRQRPILAVYAAIALLGASHPTMAQSISNTSFWTGNGGDGAWSNVANWNFGPANAPATKLPEANSTIAKKVLFGESGMLPTGSRSIQLTAGSSVLLSSGSFTVRDGSFNLDLNGSTMTFGVLTLGDSSGNLGNIAFTNSNAAKATVTLNGLTLWTDGASGHNTFRFQDVFGPNIDLNIGAQNLSINSTAGGTYTVDVNGESFSPNTVQIGSGVTDTVKAGLVNTSPTASTITFANLLWNSTVGYGTSATWSDLFGANINATSTGTGAFGFFTIGTTGGSDFTWDLQGHNFAIDNIVLGSAPIGGTNGKVGFVSTGGQSTIAFKSLSLASSVGYGSTLHLSDIFGSGITPVVAGSGTLEIGTSNGQDLAIDLDGISPNFTTLNFGTVGPIGKVTFVNSGAPSTFTFGGLSFPSLESYGTNFRLGAFFGSNITPTQGVFTASLFIGSTAPGSTFDLEGNALRFGLLTLGSGAGKTTDLTFTNSGAQSAITFSGITLGASGSAGNVFKASKNFGPNVTGSFNGPSAVSIGSASGGINNALILDSGTATVGPITISSGGSIVSNNRVEVTNAVMNVNGIGIGINGFYDPSTGTQANNQFLIGSGGQVKLSSNSSSAALTVGDGSAFQVKDGGQFKFASLPNGGQNGSLSATIGDHGSFSLTNGSTFITDDGNPSGRVRFSIAQGGTFLVDDSQLIATSSSSDSSNFDVSSNATISNGSNVKLPANLAVRATGHVVIDNSTVEFDGQGPAAHTMIGVTDILNGSQVTLTSILGDNKQGALSFANAGHMTVDGGSSVTLGVNTPLLVSGVGELDVKGNSTFFAAAWLPGNGVISVEDGSTFRIGSLKLTGNSSATLTPNGRVACDGIAVAAGASSKAFGIMTVSSQTILQLTGGDYDIDGLDEKPGKGSPTAGTLTILGTLEGNGRIGYSPVTGSQFVSTNVTVSGGRIHPGTVDGPGVLAVKNLNIAGAPAAESEVTFTVFGPGEGEYDQLQYNQGGGVSNIRTKLELAPALLDTLASLSPEEAAQYLAVGTTKFQFFPQPTLGGIVTTVEFGDSAAQLAAHGLAWDTSNLATTGAIGIKTMVRQNSFDTWRQQYFGTTDNNGTAADTAAPAGDGIANLLKFGTGQDPTVPGAMPGQAQVVGDNIVFTYLRNKAAVGVVTFSVKWSDTLAADSWSSEGVTETSAVDQGATELVTVTVPKSSGTKRFVRLEISH
jgi:hypothetical protein